MQQVDFPLFLPGKPEMRGIQPFGMSGNQKNVSGLDLAGGLVDLLLGNIVIRSLIDCRFDFFDFFHQVRALLESGIKIAVFRHEMDLFAMGNTSGGGCRIMEQMYLLHLIQPVGGVVQPGAVVGDPGIPVPDPGELSNKVRDRFGSIAFQKGQCQYIFDKSHTVQFVQVDDEGFFRSLVQSMALVRRSQEKAGNQRAPFCYRQSLQTMLHGVCLESV